MRNLAAQFLALAEKQGATVPLMIGHRLMGTSLVQTGDIAEGRTHLDHAMALYEPAEHRPLATPFGQDVGVAILSYRSLALWLRGYPDAALADADHALSDAREIGHAVTLMYALFHASFPDIRCGKYAAANALVDELLALADEKGSLSWQAYGMLVRGWLFAQLGKASDAVQIITAGLSAFRSTGSTVFMPLSLSSLTRAYAELGQFDDARRCIGEAITAVETTKEKWWEAEVHRMAGEIALKSPRRMRRKRKRISSAHSRLRASSKQSPGNSVRRRAWRGSGAIRASGMRLAIFSLRSTAGSPKGLTRST